MNDNQFFSDGVGNIAVIGTTVRIDFASLSPTERDESGQPKVQVTHRVVMPLEGFLHSVTKLRNTVQALSRRGAIRPAITEAREISNAPLSAPAPPEISAPNTPVHEPSPPAAPKPNEFPFP